jgi:hypothetical protein
LGGNFIILKNNVICAEVAKVFTYYYYFRGKIYKIQEFFLGAGGGGG